MKPDGSDVRILDEFICMSYAYGEDFIRISAKDENGFTVYRNTEPLPDRVFSLIDTVLMADALWYTIPNKQNLGTYTDKNGNKRSIATQNGTAFYRYDLTTGEKTEYDCKFIYGVSEFCGSVGQYMIVYGCAEDKLLTYWIFNSEDPSEAYRLYAD